METGRAEGLLAELIDFGSVAWRSLGESVAQDDAPKDNVDTIPTTTAKMAFERSFGLMSFSCKKSVQLDILF